MRISILPAKKWTSEWWLLLFLSVVWASALVGYARGVIMRIPGIGEYTVVIEYLFYIIPLIGALPSIIHKIRIYDILFYLACLGYILLSYFIATNTIMLENYTLRFLFLVVPLYFVGRLVDFHKLEKSFTIISVVSVIASIFYMGIYVKSGLSNVEFDADNMGASYTMLPYLLFLIASTFKKFSLFKIILSIIGVVFTISLGTRGPLLCITVFVFLMILYNTRSKYKRAILLLIIVFGTFAYIYIDQLMSWLLGLFTDLDLSTRIIDYYLSGSISNDSGRSDLQNALWDLLKDGQHPFGYGLFSSWTYIGTYPHSLIIDVLFSFGYLIGGGLLLAFSIMLFMSVKKSSLEERAFLFVLFCSSFVKLLLSGTFVLEPYLFLLIGYCMSINNRTCKVYNGPCCNTNQSIVHI